MQEVGALSSFEMAILALGLISNVLLIGGWIFSLVKKTRTTTIILAGCGLLFALVAMGLSWFGYVQGRAEVQEAIAKAGATVDAEIAMARIVDASANVTMGFLVSALPLLLGLALLMRGMFFLAAPEGQSGGRFSWIAVVICLSLGFGLSLVAFVDYLRLDDFLALMFVLS